jgi:hypothetical protein
MRPPGRFHSVRRRSFFRQGPDKLFRRLTCGFRYLERLLGRLARVTFVGELVLIALHGLFSALSLRESLLKPLLRRARINPELGDHVTLALKGFDGFVLREFGMADLGPQIMCEGLHLGERPLRPFAGGGFRGQRRLSALQSAARRRDDGSGSAMRRQIVPLVAAEHGDWNISILDKSAPVQPTVEPIAPPMRLLRPFRVGSMTLPFTQQAKGFSHLRFGVIARLGIAAGRWICRSDHSVLLAFAREILES